MIFTRNCYRQVNTGSIYFFPFPCLCCVRTFPPFPASAVFVRSNPSSSASIPAWFCCLCAARPGSGEDKRERFRVFPRPRSSGWSIREHLDLNLLPNPQCHCGGERILEFCTEIFKRRINTQRRRLPIWPSLHLLSFCLAHELATPTDLRPLACSAIDAAASCSADRRSCWGRRLMCEPTSRQAPRHARVG
jgi:hypothetical protein